MRVDVGSGVDSLDPGIAFTPESWQSLWNVYLAPYGYTRSSGQEGTQIVPALAEDMPRISDGGRSYRFRLRKGLRYSNGKSVLASDFAYAIRRLYLLDSLAAPLFDDIVGASVNAARRGSIPGIESDDIERTVTIHLRRPRASFLNVLAYPFAAPVPQSTPGRDQTPDPIPATGPYRLDSVHWPREFILARNRLFTPTSTLPQGNADRIVVSIVKDSRTAFERLCAGQTDFSDVPIDLSSLERAEKKGLLRIQTRDGANTHYFFMNTEVRPFNDVRVRQAVNHALDRNRLARIFGDLAVPSENILPLLYPSYREHRLYPYNLWRARALVRRAKAVGAAVTVYAPTKPEAARAAAFYLTRQLREIGLRPEPVSLLPPALYWSRIGARSTQARIGYAYWIQTIPHPLSWFEALFGNEQLSSPANTNYSFADNERISSAVAELSAEPLLTDEVDERWADLDQTTIEWAPIAPFLHLREVDVFGPLVDPSCYVANPVFGVDYGRVCMS